MRYKDSAGNNVQDATASSLADPARMKSLLNFGKSNNFDLNYVGLGLENTGAYDVRTDHADHLHMGVNKSTYNDLHRND